MGDVYKHATEVIIWLGDPNPEYEPSLTGLSQGILHLAKCGTNDGWMKERADVSHLLNTLTSTGRDAFAKLCSHSYWTRLWIVQEILLANKLLIHYGRHSFVWNGLAIL